MKFQLQNGNRAPDFKLLFGTPSEIKNPALKKGHVFPITMPYV